MSLRELSSSSSGAVCCFVSLLEDGIVLIEAVAALCALLDLHLHGWPTSSMVEEPFPVSSRWCQHGPCVLDGNYATAESRGPGPALSTFPAALSLLPPPTGDCGVGLPSRNLSISRPCGAPAERGGGRAFCAWLVGPLERCLDLKMSVEPVVMMVSTPTCLQNAMRVFCFPPRGNATFNQGTRRISSESI